MPPSMYRLSIPVFVRGFGVLSAALDKAERFGRDHGGDSESLVGARLAPDMLPLSGQVQRASDTSKNAIARLAGIDAPRFADTETTFSELQQRIRDTLGYFSGIAPQQLEGSEARDIALDFGSFKAVLPGDDYLLTFALPNFYFHLATTHAILRQQGVQIGKLDYLGAFA